MCCFPTTLCMIYSQDIFCRSLYHCIEISSIHPHSSIVLINSIPFFHSFLFQFNKSLHNIMYSTIINFLSLSRPYSIPLSYTSFHILFLIVSISYNWYWYWFGLIWMIEHNKFISVQRVILLLLMFMKELIHCEE